MNQVVMPYEDGKWAVKPEGDDSAPANIFDTKEAAIERQRKLPWLKIMGL
jgi:hypothetical protein